MNLAMPYSFDGRGRTASTGSDRHVEQMMQEILFTAPGERVNRPTFGCGLARLVFAPNSDQLAAATHFLVQGSLQQWLGDLILVNAVQVDNVESTLTVTVQYTLRRTQQQLSSRFIFGAAGQ